METKWQTGPKQIRWSPEKYEGRGFSVSELVEEQRKEDVLLSLGHLYYTILIFHDSIHNRTDLS